MALTIQNLNAGLLSNAAQSPILSGVAGKSILVKNIILTNMNASNARTVTVNAYIKWGTPPGTMTEFPLCPVNVSIAPKQQLIIDAEITLQSTNSLPDSLTGVASVANDVSFVINGMLRDI